MKLNENKKLLEDVRGLMIEYNIDRSYYNDEEFIKSFIDLFDKTLEKKKAETLEKLQARQPVRTLGATDWKQYIEQATKTGLESPTPYKVIPYKNGIGIKKIEFLILYYTGY